MYLHAEPGEKIEQAQSGTMRDYNTIQSNQQLFYW